MELAASIPRFTTVTTRFCIEVIGSMNELSQATSLPLGFATEPISFDAPPLYSMNVFQRLRALFLSL